MKKVSVILTTYNSACTIQNTLHSIYNQTGINQLFELELLVIDDCSTDQTCEILKENNIEYFSTHENSGGPKKGRNVGLKLASGDFICFIDHDDAWHLGKILSQLPVAEIFPVVSSGYRVENVEVDKNYERKSLIINRHVVFKANETFLHILKRNHSGQNLYLSTLMISGRLKHILFEENFGMVDYDWLLRITENNETAEIIACLVTRHVTHSNLSLDSGYRLKDYYYSLYFLENYRKKYPAEYAIAIKRLNGTRARYYYVRNEMKEARTFFFKSEFNLKQVAYILTSFIGSRFIKSNFVVFG